MPSVTVEGVPAGAGNLRRGQGRALYNPDKRTAPWKGQVAEAVAAQREGMPVTRMPVALLCTFYFTRPAGHFKRSGGLSSTARPRPTVKPDIDKLVRAVLDALTGVLYADDSQVVQLATFKHYGDRARLDLSWDVLPSPGDRD